jgi:hypothetical protein
MYSIRNEFARLREREREMCLTKLSVLASGVTKTIGGSKG